MKNLKAELNKALSKKNSAKKADDVKQSAKLSAKLKASAQALGAKIVATAIEAHSTTKELLLACKGKSALELAEIKQAVKDAWTKYADGLTARGTHSSRAEVEQMRRASIYNRNSEMQAVLSAYEKYSMMDKGTRKVFDAKHDDASGYHALVLFCRHFNRGNKTASNNAPAPAARERKAWQNKQSERIQKAKQALRFAPLSALVILSEYIEKRIEQEKRSLTQAKSGKSASVSKMRKAA